MVRIILLLLIITFIAAWIGWAIRRTRGYIEGGNPSQTNIKTESLKDIDNPLEAASALMIAVARMDGDGKLSAAQSRHIRQELESKMALTPGAASAMLGKVRSMTRSYNRAQSILPAVAPALKNALTEDEIGELVGMLTVVAEGDGPINRDQMEFIANVRDRLDKDGLAWHLAQINIAYFKAPKFNTANDDFHKAIDDVNAIAESAHGFVWRLEDDEAERVGIDMFRDPDMIVNMSVWKDMESLSAFVYRDKSHRAVMRRKEEWFKDMEIYMALWWIKAGETPTLKDAEHRLNLLAGRGPTDEAFTFKEPFPPPAADDVDNKSA